MKSRWLKTCTESEKAAVKKQIKQATPVLDRLAVLLTKDLDSSLRSMASRENFNSPAWEDKIAHYLGEQTALRSIIELINLEEK